MRVLQRLLRSRSSCSASQQSLPPRSVWQPCNTVLTAVGFPLLGQAGFSEWSLLASFPGSFSILPIFCPFCSPFHCFCHLLRVQHPILHDFRSSVQDELFHNLVAQFVGPARRRHQQRAQTAAFPPLALARVGLSLLPTSAASASFQLAQSALRWPDCVHEDLRR